MASSPITSSQINGETVETVADFFEGLQSYCRCWLQPWNWKTVTPWKESYDQPRQQTKKQRHYFANKGPSSHSYGFPCSHVWMWELDCKESWALKNWCFWTVVLEKILRVPWTARRSNQSILKEISPECSLWDWCWSWNSNTLATWWEELTHLKRPWCWERLRAGGEGDSRGWGGWMASLTQWSWARLNSGSWWWTGRPGALQSMGSQRVWHDWETELNWTAIFCLILRSLVSN